MENLPAVRYKRTNVTNKIWGGVFGGLERSTGIDASIMRVGFAAITLLTGTFWIALIMYIVTILVTPAETDNWTE